MITKNGTEIVQPNGNTIPVVFNSSETSGNWIYLYVEETSVKEKLLIAAVCPEGTIVRYNSDERAQEELDRIEQKS